MNRNKIVVIAILFAGLVVAGYLYNKYRIAPRIECSRLVLEDLNGVAINMDSLKDKKLLLNFFATWCGSCIREMPDLEKTSVILRDNDYVLLCISDEPLERLRSFSQRLQLPIRIVHSVKPFAQLKIFTYPTSYVLNLNREVVFKKAGDVNWTDEQFIQKLKGI